MIAFSLFFFAAAAVQQGGMVQVPVSGRDYVTVADTTEVITGTCDGRSISATITKAFQGRPGQLTLRSGRLSRRIPSSFLGGRLTRGTFYAAGLGCDGRRALFRARAVQMDERGRLRIQVQSATMDLTTGRLSLSALRNLSDEEISLELR